VRLAHFDCVSGVSGDMTLGALVSAGWPEEELRAIPARLRLEGVAVEVSPVRRGAFAALRVEVRAPERQPHRHLHHVARLAAAEAEVHGTTVAKVHFHEVGAVDALVDVAGACVGLEALGVARVSCSELPLGGGTVLCEHGRIPVPAPATALLLRGARVRMGPVEAELVTPTGAALLATLADGFHERPGSFRLEAVGMGAGAREFPEHPNVLRVLLGQEASGAVHAREVAVLETAIDDDNPQFLADLVPRLLAAGALDAMLVPTVMKKGRAGSWLVVVSEVAHSEQLAEMILAGSTSLGVRVRQERRLELARVQRTVSTAAGPVELKIARLPDGSLRAQPEYESLRAASERSGLPLRELAEAAIAAWRASGDPGPA
jgi:uncharacterized protein (TIGR00299 family) protein